MSESAHLHLRDTPGKRMPLQTGQPLTIGSARNNSLALISQPGVSPHHAVVRFTANHGWVVCDWQSSDGTYLEGERIRRCRPLSDGDEIRLGRQGPVLVFSLAAPKPPQAQSRPGHTKQQRAAAPGPRPQPTIDIDGNAVPVSQIRSAVVLSEPRYPHIFSWWLLTCVGGLLLLPFPYVFWPLQLTALASWILLGSRKSHTLLVVQHDGQAHRRCFSNRMTALSHRNGIRKAIGQSLETP